MRATARARDAGAAPPSVSVRMGGLGGIIDAGKARSQASLPATLEALARIQETSQAAGTVAISLSARAHATDRATSVAASTLKIGAAGTSTDAGGVLDAALLPEELTATGRIEDFGQGTPPSPRKWGFSAAFSRAFAAGGEPAPPVVKRGFSAAFSRAFAWGSSPHARARVEDAGAVRSMATLPAAIEARGLSSDSATAGRQVAFVGHAHGLLADSAQTAGTVAIVSSADSHATDRGTARVSAVRRIEAFGTSADTGCVRDTASLPAELTGAGRILDESAVRDTASMPAEIAGAGSIEDTGVITPLPSLPAELAAPGRVLEDALARPTARPRAAANGGAADAGGVLEVAALPEEPAASSWIGEDGTASMTVEASARAAVGGFADAGGVIEAAILPAELAALPRIEDTGLASTTALVPLEAGRWEPALDDAGAAPLTTRRKMAVALDVEDEGAARVTITVCLAAAGLLADDGRADRPRTALVPRAFGAIADAGRAELRAEYLPWMPLVPSPTAIAYRQTLQALLPLGDAWPRHKDATLTRLMMAWAEELAWTDIRAVRLLSEAMPASARELLAEWEAIAGLPDDCGAELDTTYEERRRALVAMLTRQGGSSLAWWQAWSARQGFEITIEEFIPFMAGMSRCGIDRLWGGPRVRYHWRVRIPGNRYTPFRTGVSCCGERLGKISFADGLMCRMRRFAPAHIHLTFHYS